MLSMLTSRLHSPDFVEEADGVMKISFDGDIDRDFRVKFLIGFRPRAKQRISEPDCWAFAEMVLRRSAISLLSGKLRDGFLKLGIELLKILLQARQVCRFLRFTDLFIARDFYAVGQFCYLVRARAI